MTVTDISISQESQDRYLTYALSVVSSRALPDVRDGLKPVQRRILYAMLKGLKLGPDGGHRKSAKVVGEVLGSYHPHGDISCYESMVRMAQDFSLRYPLVDGQGNFGSLDGDAAAAYRYTEVKLRALAIEVIGEIDQDTVPFRENFDSTTTEPVVFPSKVPNLLINGASGIAVGMSTNIPPHNLTEVISALTELLADPEISNSKLVTLIKGPDFPTGCQILSSKKELEAIYQSGRGSIRMRADWKEEDLQRGKKAIVVTTIPYAINKSQLVERIAGLIIERKLPQINDIRDESTDDVRIVLELASGADPEVAMAYLFKNTPLENSFAVNMTALVPVGESGACRPELLSLKQILQHFLDFRVEIVKSRLSFEKRKLEERVHILEGLVKIFDALDEALKIVRKSDGRSDAATKLATKFKLTEIQAYAVVDMRIYQLSRTNMDEVLAELKEKLARIAEIEKILGSRARIVTLVRQDLEDIGTRFGDKRKCKIIRDNFELEFNAEDYVVQEDVFAIVTADGWLKRIRQSNDVSSTRIREGDRILNAHALNTIDSVAFITNHGSLYVVRVTDFSSSSGYGEPIQKILKFADGERIVRSYGIRAESNKSGEEQKGSSANGASGSATNNGKGSERQMSLLDSIGSKGDKAGTTKGDYLSVGDSVVLVSSNGVGFIFQLEELALTKRTGKRIMKLRDGTELAVIAQFNPKIDSKIALVTKLAYGLAIAIKEIPVKNSAVMGVSLIGVRPEDRLIGAVAFSKARTVSLELDSGKIKEVSTSEIVVGKRALKGNKVVARGEIKGVS